MSRRETRLPRFAAKSVAPLDPAALVIGSIGDVAAGLKVEWRDTQRADMIDAIVECRRLRVEHDAVHSWFRWVVLSQYDTIVVADDGKSLCGRTATQTEAKRAAVLALAAHLRSVALKAIPLAQSGAGAAAKPFCKGLCYPDDPCTPEKPCPSGGHHRDVPKALTDAIDKAPKPTPAEVANARGIRVGDRVRVKEANANGTTFAAGTQRTVQAVTDGDGLMVGVHRDDGVARFILRPCHVELLPAEAPAFEWVGRDSCLVWAKHLDPKQAAKGFMAMCCYLNGKGDNHTTGWRIFVDDRDLGPMQYAPNLDEAKRAAEAAFVAATKPPPYEIG